MRRQKGFEELSRKNGELLHTRPATWVLSGSGCLQRLYSARHWIGIHDSLSLKLPQSETSRSSAMRLLTRLICGGLAGSLSLRSLKIQGFSSSRHPLSIG